MRIEQPVTRIRICFALDHCHLIHLLFVSNTPNGMLSMGKFSLFCHLPCFFSVCFLPLLLKVWNWESKCSWTRDSRAHGPLYFFRKYRLYKHQSQISTITTATQLQHDYRQWFSWDNWYSLQQCAKTAQHTLRRQSRPAKAASSRHCDDETRREW